MDFVTTMVVDNEETSLKEETTSIKRNKNDYYAILEVTPMASQKEITSAYRKKVMEYHPDRLQTFGKELRELADKKTKVITKAYRVLSNKKRRAEYDREMKPSIESISNNTHR